MGEKRNSSSNPSNPTLLSDTFTGTRYLDDRSMNMIGYIILFMDTMYVFAIKSLEFYVLFGMAQFTLNVDDRTVLSYFFTAKFYGTCFTLVYGIICDSYIGRHIITSVFITIMVMLPILYSCISFPYLMLSTGMKLTLFECSMFLLATQTCIEPVRTVVVVTSLCSENIKSPRMMFSILVTLWNVAIGVAGLQIYLCLNSRAAFTAAMICNVIILFIYAGFFIFFRHFYKQRPTEVTIVGKAVANCCCYLLKKVDRFIFKSKLFTIQGWKDFNCFKFNASTVLRAQGLLGIVIIMLPLTLNFSLQVTLDIAYIVQFSTLYFKTQQIPLASIRAFAFILLFPVCEYIFRKLFNKNFKAELLRDFIFIGIGGVFITLATIWSSILQQQVSFNERFWEMTTSDKQLTLVNCLEEPVNIRGTYLNKLKGLPANQWTRLEQMQPIRLVNIAPQYWPFHITVMNGNLSLYDDHDISPMSNTYNWFFLLPWEIFKIPKVAFHPSKLFSVNPKLFPPAKVSVICALPMCQGSVSLKGKNRYVRERLETTHSTVLKLVGKHNISYEFGNMIVNFDKPNFAFEYLSSYALVIHENGTSRNASENRRAVTNASLGSDSSKLENKLNIEKGIAVTISVITLSQQRKHSVQWIYPMIALNIIGDIFTQVSIMSCTYKVSPPDLRATTFCLVHFLSLPTLSFFYVKTPVYYKIMLPLSIFTCACANCFFLIVYLFATLYYSHRWTDVMSGDPYGSGADKISLHSYELPNSLKGTGPQLKISN